jgi:hypothetical protein
MKFLTLIALFGAWLFAPLLQVEHEPVSTPPTKEPPPSADLKNDAPAECTAKGGRTMR